MVYPVWGICQDGPLAGLVVEVDIADRALQITTFDHDGVACYRRIGWGNDKAHRVALFKFTKTLVI